ncbi:uncharacterized protein [Physcomitrium patens]|uniref:Carboxymethylenebutenolidase homolog n=1 Tax=Physcomitrium patens TaxID=3218 RepID=A0A2K1JZZ3_PHYPA|nr:uncharacterized protein LOC112287592 isoform X3 [Physcomitrium patens]PNR47096.1 hypothetical protein PHYPA_014216 [Physcomitrium patens]|eukprot:XP_024386502.1 uncharacterized protein LOC112287592 isoform X3 [Physcomitrella patens]
MAMAISAAGAATRTANIALVPPQSLLARAHVQCTVIGAVWKQRSGPVSAQFCAAPRKPPLARQVLVHAQAEETEEMDAAEDVDICELVNGFDVQIGDEGEVSGFYIQALKNNNGAGILLLPDIFGWESSATRDIANQLGCFGYNVLVLDLFRGNSWKEGVSQASGDFEAWRSSHTNIAKDIDAASRWLKAAVDEQGHAIDPNSKPKCAIVGFCIGGGLAIQTIARYGSITTEEEVPNPFSAAVSFYGTRINLQPEQIRNIKSSLMMITGDLDPSSPVQGCEDIVALLDDAEVVVYPGRGHGFAHRPKSLEDDEAAEVAFSTMMKWLKRRLLTA